MAQITEPTVTDNARLLCGFIGGSIHGDTYQVVDANAEEGRLLIESPHGNQYMISVQQISGFEYQNDVAVEA